MHNVCELGIKSATEKNKIMVAEGAALFACRVFQCKDGLGGVLARHVLVEPGEVLQQRPEISSVQILHYQVQIFLFPGVSIPFHYRSTKSINKSRFI
jgi:hypothetical protein